MTGCFTKLPSRSRSQGRTFPVLPDHTSSPQKDYGLRLTHLDTEGMVAPHLPIFTIGVSVQGHPGPSTVYETQALEDTGATANFISLELAEQMGCEPIPDEFRTVGLGDLSRIKCHGYVVFDVTLDSRHPDVKVPMEAYVVDQLGFPLIIGYPFGYALKKMPVYPDERTDGVPQVRWTVNGMHLFSPILMGVHSDAQLHHMALDCKEHGPMLGVVLRTPGDKPEQDVDGDVLDPTLPKKSGNSVREAYFKMLNRAPERLRQLLIEFEDLFIPTGDIRKGHGVEATIPTEEGEVAFAKQFPLSHREMKELEKMLQELVDKDWVQPAHSAFNNPIFLVPKPNGKFRIVLDFRNLNRITKKDKYRLPRVDHLLTDVMKWNCISTMDLVDGFFQIPLAEADRDKTAFTTPWGSFKWTVMPMGLTNAPSIFQGVTDSLLDGLRHQDGSRHTVGYIDDLATGGSSEADHDSALRGLFLRIREFGLHLSPAKCSYGETTTQFLGYQVGSGTLGATQAKLDAVKDFPRPTSQSQVRRFLGMVGYMQKLMDHYHIMAGPLERLCGRKDQAPRWSERNWGTEQEEAFIQLKQSLAREPVLHAPRWDDTEECPFILATDASGFGMGGVLLQRSAPGVDPPCPLGYWSRTFNETEQRVLATHERELCAIMEGLEFFGTIIRGYTLQVWCDHKPLQYLWTQPRVTAKQCRWAARIAEFLPFTFEYTPGTSPDMRIPDALSRQHEDDRQKERGPLHDEQPDLARAMRAGQPQTAYIRLNHMTLNCPRTATRPLYVLLLCSGKSRSVERYLRHRDPTTVIYTLDLDPGTSPTVCGDVRDWRRLLAQLVLPPGQGWDLIWASPPCRLLSNANTSGASIDPGLELVQACMDCIRQLRPRLWILENPASGPRALHKQPLMLAYESLRIATSYCWYGALYRKATSFWTNFGGTLRMPCTHKDLCPCVQTFGHHPFTAQAGPSQRSTHRQEGMGSGAAVEGYPTRLLHALLDPVIPSAHNNGLLLQTLDLTTDSDQPLSAGEDIPLEGSSPQEEVSLLGSSLPGLKDVTLRQELLRAYRNDKLWHLLNKTKRGSAVHVRFELKDGLIRLRQDRRIYVPKKAYTVIEHIVGLAHEHGHFGIAKTYAQVVRHFWWGKMHQDISHLVMSCATCANQKTKRLPRPGLLQPIPVQSEAWRCVSVDWISGLPLVELKRTNISMERPNGTRWEATDVATDTSVNSILVLTDRYSKAVRLRAVHKSTNSRHVLEWLTEELYRCFGWPKHLIHDNDLRFGAPYKAYLQGQGIELHFTSGYHPASNGLVERMNSTVMNVLRTVCNGIPFSWPYGLPHAEFAINSSPNVAGVAPFDLVLQFPPRTPLENAVGLPRDKSGDRPILPTHSIHRLVQSRMREEQIRQKRVHDQGKKELRLKENDQVYLRRSSVGMPRDMVGEQAVHGQQMRSPFLGPFRVIRRKRNCDTYVLDVAPYRFGEAWHVSHLVRAHPSDDFLSDATELQPGAILARAPDLDGGIRYLVRWQGMSHPTWEEERTLRQTNVGTDLLNRFRGQHPGTESCAIDDPDLQEHPEWLEHVL